MLAIDHPADWRVFPDERLAVTGPPPTHELLGCDNRSSRSERWTPPGRIARAKLFKVDRIYAYEPQLDRRFFGFCRPHTWNWISATSWLPSRTNQRLFLFINGFIEYPYSQTVYAAGQARIGWEPIRIERRMPDGHWKTIVPDAGAPGGMARMMTWI